MMQRSKQLFVRSQPLLDLFFKYLFNLVIHRLSNHLDFQLFGSMIPSEFKSSDTLALSISMFVQVELTASWLISG